MFVGEMPIITVNQRDEVAWYEGMTVSDLLEKLKYSYPHIIVSINGTLVQPHDYDSQTIPDGADIRAIHLIAGG